MSRTRNRLVLLLVLVTLAAFWQAGSHDFINYDDNLYVTDNPQVKAGLSFHGVYWAFTTTHAGNWHPLTWLSHMADVELYGLRPHGHHITSVLLHCVNVLLLFFLLARSTGDLWPCFFVAALFGLHPLRAESVVWVAERKDVLSTMFALMTLLTYVRYVVRPRVGVYLLFLCLFVLGLMAKPMLVTLPFVMLLFDYWPLRRLGSERNPVLQIPETTPARLFCEKIPLFALAAVSSLITFNAQQLGRTVASVEAYPLLMRLENALTAYLRYLASMIYPLDLAVFYPLPTVTHPEKAIGAALLLAALTVMAVRFRQRLPFIVSGWFWYLGTLVPVIGLLQVGAQARADRYTYFPMIGIAMVAAWGGKWFSRDNPVRQRVCGALAGFALIMLFALTWRQTGYWRNSQALFRHAIAVTNNNYVALSFLATDLFNRGHYPEASRYYALSLSIKPQQAEAHHNFGLTLRRQGDDARAEQHFREAIRLMPDLPESHYALGLVLADRKEFKAASAAFSQAVSLRPDYADARRMLDRCRELAAVRQ